MNATENARATVTEPERLTRPVLRVIDPTGEVVGKMPEISDETLVNLFRQLVRTRTFDERALHLQRTGRIPAYYPCAGQEGHVAIPLALHERDWIFSAYREQGVRLARGVPVLNELALWRGMPFAIWDPHVFRITPINATIGTHLPHATGYSYGNRLLGGDDVAVAIFGDGATSEVDFHAALNFAGVLKTPTVFFCQNNQYAQSTPLAEQTAARTLADKALAYGFRGVQIDGMDPIAVYQSVQWAAERARAGRGPTLIEALCYRYTPHSTYDGTPVYRTRDEEREWREQDPLERMRRFLASRGLLKEGLEAEIRDETRRAVDAAIEELEAMALPPRAKIFRSVYTRMPARLAEQLRREEELAGEPVTTLAPRERFTPGEDEIPSGETKDMTLVEALNMTLERGLETLPNMVILGEDVGREGGVFRVTDGLYERFGRERLLDTPLCELGIVGTAVGMALAGLKPVCEIEFAGFTFTAFDQIVFHVARYPWRTGGAFRMPLVIRMPAGGGHEGYEGHSDSPEAFFVHAPGGLVVVYPSNAIDAKGLMASALQSDDPVIFFEPVAQYFVREKGVPVEQYSIPIGRAKVVREGTDLTVVAYGNAVGIAGRAADILAGEGISMELIDLRTLRPWDEQTVLDSVSHTGRLVVAHEAPLTGGLGAEIVATVVEKAGDLLETPPARVGHADLAWAPAKLEPYSMIAPERIVNAARRVLEN